VISFYTDQSTYPQFIQTCMKVFLTIHPIIVSAFLFLTSCSSDSQRRELSQFELEHGIGPVTEKVSLGDPDSLLAEKGNEIFLTYCTMCHGPGMSRIAPELDQLLKRRSAEYVMNMILNPAGMSRRHPSRTQSQQGYLTSMPYQQLTLEDARALVEYFRINPVFFENE